MKRELNLPKHPNIVFLIIVFDLFALVAVYGLYSSNWVGEAGIPIKLNSSKAQNFPISENHISLKVLPAPANHYILGNSSIPSTELAEKLEYFKVNHNVDQVLLITDQNTTVQKEREVLNIIKNLNISCILVAANNNSEE